MFIYTNSNKNYSIADINHDKIKEIIKTQLETRLSDIFRKHPIEMLNSIW